MQQHFGGNNCALNRHVPPISLDPSAPVSLAIYDATFTCSGNGAAVELITVGKQTVKMRTKWTEGNGKYCYLTTEDDLPFYVPGFDTKFNLKWDCAFGTASQFNVTNLGTAQVQLTKHVGLGTCGVALDTSSNSAQPHKAVVDCAKSGDALYLAESVKERWDDGIVAEGHATQFGPFKIIPDSEVRAELKSRNQTTGDADIYLRFGQAPTINDYDCRPYTNTSDELCRVTVPSGTSEVYIMVRGYRSKTDYELTVNYVTPD